MTGIIGSGRWDLPGPSRFLSRIADALSSPDGAVCVAMPCEPPHGVLEALAARIEERGGVRVLPSDASGGIGPRGPAHWLAARVALSTGGIRSAADFLDTPTLADVVFLVHGMPRAEWRQWASFLRLLKVERERRERLVAPSILVVSPPGVPPGEIRAIFGRRDFRWQGRISRLDTEMAVQGALGWPSDDDLESRVANACMAGVAGWDLRLVDYLGGLPVAARIEPLEHLREMAVSLPRATPTWENGLIDLWDGHPFEHTLSMIARGAEDAFLERLWDAQVREAFPFLNVVRRATIARHREALAKSLADEPLIREFRGGKTQHVLHPERMESSEIQFRLAPKLREHELSFLKACSFLRNCMAHMNPAPAACVSRISRYWEENSDRYPSDCLGWDWPRCDQRLVVMVGPSGAGKSTWAAAHHPTDIVSSDAIRTRLYGSVDAAGDQEPIFDQLRRDVMARLSSGRTSVIDATNMDRGHRMANARLAPPDMRVEYVVVDRPLADKLATAGWRATKPWLIPTHATEFETALDDILKGDDLPNVKVIDNRCETARPLSRTGPEAA